MIHGLSWKFSLGNPGISNIDYRHINNINGHYEPNESSVIKDTGVCYWEPTL